MFQTTSDYVRGSAPKIVQFKKKHPTFTMQEAQARRYAAKARAAGLLPQPKFWSTIKKLNGITPTTFSTVGDISQKVARWKAYPKPLALGP